MHKPSLFRINLVIFLLFTGLVLKAQDSPIQQAIDFPTKEVYDLHIDKHGFLWIANDFGVARYDGVNCVYFSSPKQISLGCTDLMEDKYGRIWYHNFNGQLFYIDNENVVLAANYDYKKESNYPRLALFHDKLLATSDRGLFVLDTKDLTAKYIISSYTTSLAVLKNQVLIHGGKNWYIYTEAKGLKKIAYVGDEQIAGHVYSLNTATYNDTIYMMSNPSGSVKKLVIKNDTVKQCGEIKYNSFINTLSITPDNQWVNTIDCSYSLKTGEKIKGHNLSDIVTDQEGNRWFGSLYYGLLIQHKKDIASKTVIAALDTDDLVVSVKNYKQRLVLGTRKGFLMLYDPAKKGTDFKLKLSPTGGSINSITAVNGDDFIVGSSLSTYKIDVATQKVKELVGISTAKQVFDDGKATYIASASGLYVIPHDRSVALNQQLAKTLGSLFKYSDADNYFFLRKRSRAICYFPDQDALFVSIKNSLFKIDKNGMTPFLFENEQVYAASLAYVDHRFYIGTISNGMLIVEKNHIEHISAQNGLFSRDVFKFKLINKNLWIVGSGPLQIFNTQTQQLINNYAFPDRNASQMFDIDGAGQMIYLASPTGLDNFPLLKNSADKKLKNYLLYLKIDNKTAALDSSHQLSYAQNNVLFNIGVPAYLKAKDIYIKYSLATKTDTTWLTTEPGERSIHFSSLMPGNYTFKAIAIDPRLGMAASMINYEFTIAEPWWASVPFKMLIGFVFMLVILYGYVTMLRKRLALRKAFDTQQQLILAERQRISGEIHDDIQSGIFAIHSLANKGSKSQSAGPEIGEIKELIDEVSVKIREIIWTTNVGNDNLENLLLYTYFQINKLFEHSAIEFVSELPADIPDLNITGQSRRNVYLLVKELVHNAIKHSKATTVELKMFTDEQTLHIAVNDNGIGINTDNSRPDSMGLSNMRARVEKLNGMLTIANNGGAHISVNIPLNDLQPIAFDRKLNKWQYFITRLLKIPSSTHRNQ